MPFEPTCRLDNEEFVFHVLAMLVQRNGGTVTLTQADANTIQALVLCEESDEAGSIRLTVKTRQEAGISDDDTGS